jgi:hypothetical protein
MEKYKYGPLVYNTTHPDDDDSGNFYWPGLPPVGYDELAIPIDEKGFQCLDDSSPLHPHHKPSLVEPHLLIGAQLPTIESVKAWFDDNFLLVSEWEVCRYILRWYNFQPGKTDLYKVLVSESESIEEVIEKLWPDVQKS